VQIVEEVFNVKGHGRPSDVRARRRSQGVHPPLGGQEVNYIYRG